MSSPQSVYLAVAVVALAIGLAVFGNRRRRKALLALGAALDEGAGEIKGFSTIRIEGHYQGRAATLRSKPGSRYTPEQFFVRLASSSTLRFKIGREGMGTRLASRLGLKQDLEVGDPHLDPKYAFSSRDPERFVQWVRSSNGTAAMIDGLFDHAIDSVAHDDTAIEVTASGAGSMPRSVESVREILAAMRPIAEAVERA